MLRPSTGLATADHPRDAAAEPAFAALDQSTTTKARASRHGRAGDSTSRSNRARPAWPVPSCKLSRAGVLQCLYGLCRHLVSGFRDLAQRRRNVSRDSGRRCSRNQPASSCLSSTLTSPSWTTAQICLLTSSAPLLWPPWRRHRWPHSRGLLHGTAAGEQEQERGGGQGCEAAVHQPPAYRGGALSSCYRAAGRRNPQDAVQQPVPELALRIVGRRQ